MRISTTAIEMQKPLFMIQISIYVNSQILYEKSKETSDIIPSTSKRTPRKKSNDDEDNDNNNEGDDSGTDLNSDDEMYVSPVKKTSVHGEATPTKSTPQKATPTKTTPLKATPVKNGIKRQHNDGENSEATPSKKVIF